MTTVSDKMALWRELEIYLGSQAFSIPIYFTYESDPVMSVYRQLESGTSEAEDNQLSFVVSADEKIPLKQLNYENYYGFVYAYEESLPIIALVTHYDAFSILPDETIGMDQNGSGLIALMEIARTFFKVYAQNFPNYNLMIILSQAGTLNFDGVRQWLQTEDPEIMQLIAKIEFALCLDSLSSEGELNAHISRHPKTEETEVTRFYQVMNTTSTLTGFPLNYQKKKINIADPFVPWQHENFSRRRILAATLSNREIPYSKLLDHGSIFDASLNMTTLENNIRFITETLIRFLYDYKDEDALILYEK